MSWGCAWVAVAAALTVSAPSERSLLAQLQRLDRSLVRAERDVRANEEQRRVLSQRIAATRAEIATAEVRKDEAHTRFKGRLRVLARMPASSRVALLEGAGSLADYLKDARMLRWLARHDRTLQARYTAESDRLSILQQDLESQQQAIIEVEKRARQNRDDIGARRQERMALLQKVVARRELAERAARERAAARSKLSNMVRKLRPKGRQSTSFGRNKGRLPWPAGGAVKTPFGQKVELAFGTITAHSGIDLSSKAGERVRAVAAGRVVYADWLRGYGQLVIVDHGDQYHSLVAHLGTMAVTTGDPVQQGTILGTVGDTGSLRGTVLYFEIRHKGAPLDPSAWLRRN